MSENAVVHCKKQKLESPNDEVVEQRDDLTPIVVDKQAEEQVELEERGVGLARPFVDKQAEEQGEERGVKLAPRVVDEEGEGIAPNTIEAQADERGGGLTPRVVDLQLLSRLQNELKYQLYSTWRQLNLVETYDDNETVVARKDVAITADEYANEKVSMRESVDRVCCLKCSRHVICKDFQFHMKSIHEFEGHVNNCQSVPVLEMDKANAHSRISCDIIKKIELEDYFLYCRLCLYPVEMRRKKSLHLCIEQHKKAPIHRGKVKEFFCQPNGKAEGLPLFLQIIQVKYDPSKMDEVKENHRFVVYHPHEFCLSCCCRSAFCRYCETSPYIFSGIIPPDTKMIHCRVCNCPFVTSIGHHHADIKKHAVSRAHILKRRELLAQEGYISPDIDLFVASKK